MKVVVYYQSGKIDVFDSTNFTLAEPFSRIGKNLMTEFTLRLDLLNEGYEEGLFVDVFWYDLARTNTPISDDDTGAEIPLCNRQVGCRICLVSKNELQNIAKISLDGEMLVWRQGTGDNSELINGIKFSNQEILCFSNTTTTSINRRASSVFAYLQNAHPDKSSDEVAQMMGYSLKAIEAVQAYEAANLEDDDGLDDLVESLIDDSDI